MKISKKLSIAVVALALLASACSNEPKTEAELYNDLTEGFITELDDASTDTELEFACAFQGMTEESVTDAFDMTDHTPVMHTPESLASLEEDWAANDMGKEFKDAMLELATSEYGLTQSKIGTAMLNGIAAACDNLRRN